MTMFVRSSRAGRRAEWRRQDRERRAIERRLQSGLVRILLRAVAQMASGSEVTASTSRKVAVVLRRHTRAMAVSAIAAARSEAPKARIGAIERKESVVDRFISDYDSWLIERSKLITSTLQARVARQLRRALDEGLGQAEAARAVQSVAGGMARRQAQTIARTEMHSAQQAATRSFAESVDAEMPLNKVWIATEDERTRLTHLEAEGQKRKMDEPFSVGQAELQFPGDPAGPPEEIINCRCAATYEPRSA